LIDQQRNVKWGRVFTQRENIQNQKPKSKE